MFDVLINSMRRYVSQSSPGLMPTLVGIKTALVSWWPFDGSMVDVHGAHNMSGTATYSATTTGQKANNSTPLVTAGVIPELNTTSFTVGGRFTFNSLGAQITFLTARSSASSSYERVALVLTTDSRLILTINPFAGGSAAQTAPGAVTAGSTHCVVGTYDGAEIRIYVDDLAPVIVAFAGAIAVGQHHFELGYDFTNNYTVDNDEVFVANAALTPAQVLGLWNGGNGVSYADLP